MNDNFGSIKRDMLDRQVPRHYRSSAKNWQEFIDSGEIQHDAERFDEAFDDPQDGDKFKVGVMVAVPFTTFDSSLHGEVIAVANLTLVKHIEYEQAEVNVYHKQNPNLPAYFLYLQAEDGPVVFKV